MKRCSIHILSSTLTFSPRVAFSVTVYWPTLCEAFDSPLNDSNAVRREASRQLLNILISSGTAHLRLLLGKMCNRTKTEFQREQTWSVRALHYYQTFRAYSQVQPHMLIDSCGNTHWPTCGGKIRGDVRLGFPPRNRRPSWITPTAVRLTRRAAGVE